MVLDNKNKYNNNLIKAQNWPKNYSNSAIKLKTGEISEICNIIPNI